MRTPSLASVVVSFPGMGMLCRVYNSVSVVQLSQVFRQQVKVERERAAASGKRVIMVHFEQANHMLA